jgi:hypothetical protein
VAPAVSPPPVKPVSKAPTRTASKPDSRTSTKPEQGMKIDDLLGFDELPPVV